MLTQTPPLPYYAQAAYATAAAAATNLYLVYCCANWLIYYAMIHSQAEIHLIVTDRTYSKN